MTAAPKPAAVILAGGRSSRMGGNRKALLQLGGRSLLTRVIDRLQSQCDPLLISCDTQAQELKGFGLPLVPDLLPGYRGPLTGLYSALQYLSDNEHEGGLVLCPCDAPFISGDLVQALLNVDSTGEIPVVAISYQGVLQPTFSLWHSHHLPHIHDALVKQGFGGLKHLLRSLPHEIVEWEVDEKTSTEPSPFFNINTPADLETAAGYFPD